MSNNFLSVRELQEQDISSIAKYWLESDKGYLEAMGVDTSKLPSRNDWTKMLKEQLSTVMKEKKSYCIIWQVDDNPVGHCNVNPVLFGKEAYMHLHLWNMGEREKGFGTELIKMTVPHFFENLQLEQLYCEPNALNPSPNRALEKVGFEFVKKYITTPSPITYEQPVNRWKLSYGRYKNLYK